MANIIILKRGLTNQIENAVLRYGEPVVVFDAERKEVQLWVGTSTNSEGGTEKIRINPDFSSAIATALAEAKSYADGKISDLVNGAPEALDTLKEIADEISSNSDIMSALQSAIGNKVDKVAGKGLSTNDYSDEDKAKVDGIETALAGKMDVNAVIDGGTL